jgi:hypothetical protein
LPAAQLKYGPELDEILSEFRDDFGWDYLPDLPKGAYPASYKQGSHIDDFGVRWHCQWEGVCGIPEGPLRNLESYPDYVWPQVFSAGPPQGRLYSGHMCGFDQRWYARGAWINYFYTSIFHREYNDLNLCDITRHFVEDAPPLCTNSIAGPVPADA